MKKGTPRRAATFPVRLQAPEFLAVSALRQFSEGWPQYAIELSPLLDSISPKELFAAALNLRIPHLVATAYADHRHVRGRHSPFRTYRGVAQRAYTKQVDEWLHVHCSLRQFGVRPLVFKGLQFHERIYSEGTFTLMKDIDFLVRRDELSATSSALRASGFSQSVHYRQGYAVQQDPATIAQGESPNSYEVSAFGRSLPLHLRARELDFVHERLLAFPFLVDGPGLRFLFRVAPHHNLTYPFMDHEDLWLTPEVVDFGDEKVLTLSNEITAYFLLLRVYTETALWPSFTATNSPMKLLGDLVVLCASRKLDYETILRLAIKYQTVHHLYFALAFVLTWAGVTSVPEAVVAEAERRSRSARVKHSDVIPRLFGYRPTVRGLRTRFELADSVRAPRGE